jgi:esterase/lipase superfamily enzyme
VNLATRHPHLFTRVLALSGRYDLTRAIGPFLDLFSGYYDDNVYFHTPPHFLARLTDPAIVAALRRLDITLAVGQDDAFCASTRELSAVLHNKQIAHVLDVWPGEAHRAADWREMVRRYLAA